MLLETPGHTGTLGFGQRALAGANAGAHRDRGSYTQCGNMLADISDFACSRYAVLLHCSKASFPSYSYRSGCFYPPRDSFGSEVKGSAPAGAHNTSALGFEIFSDAPALGTAAQPSTTGKRRGLSQHPADSYSGV
jgi:hypothetical protein